MFTPLFKRYRDEVNPRAVVFLVSFLLPSVEGQLKREFDSNEIPHYQFRFDKSRPDLTKFDSLLQLLVHEATKMSENESIEH
eukprot:EC685766.1.p5 GENE.EC685766.1~~EC685766.1.p5  ORF type:complete len:82 (+),score=38.47 EC685766.1:186-431(+)